MYNNPCEHCDKHEQCMHMMNMPMMDMPMMNMPMMNMPMMNMHMMNMPMYEMTMPEHEDDDDLKRLYPKLYTMIYPMVKHHCDMMEAQHGAMYCPSKEEMDHICEQIGDMHEEHHKDEHDDDDDCKDDDMRQRRRHGRRRAVNDLIRILFLRDLFERRRRHRRRRPMHGYGY
jgi:hypothetical protein